MKKNIFRWAKVLILLYCTIGIAFYYLQDRLLFHPVPLTAQDKYDFGQPFREVNLNYNKETNLNIIQFETTDSPATGRSSTATHSSAAHLATGTPFTGTTAATSALVTIAPATRSTAPGPSSSVLATDTSSTGVVLYFHGNKGNIGRYGRHAAEFTARGYEVWMMDYPGFGKSTGPRSEQKLYDYALLLYKLARSRYRPDQIVIYGKSLGTGVAAQLASVRDCRRLILECPYFSMVSLIRHYLPIYPISTMLHYHFPTNEFLPSVTAPVAIFQGTADGLIPLSNAERLKSLLKPGDEFIPIEGGSHNDLADFPLFHQKLDSLLKIQRVP
jgi:uncharacterized protein